MSEENKILSQIHTSCKNCVFANYTADGLTQSGCKLGKIQDYKKAGIDILDVYDDELQFSVINGRVCLFYRNTDVMEQYPKDTWQDIVKLQTKVPYHAMVFIEPNTTFKEVKKICKNLKNQEISPNLVTLINKQYSLYTEDSEKYIKPSKLLSLLSNSEFHQYSLKNIYDNDLDDRSLIDLVFDSTKEKPYPFYVVFRCGFDIPESFSKDFNDSVLIKMMQLGFVKPYDDINGMIVNRTAHKKHSGNSFNINLEEKIIKFEDNGEKFIFNIGDICNHLKK